MPRIHFGYRQLIAVVMNLPQRLEGKVFTHFAECLWTRHTLSPTSGTLKVIKWKKAAKTIVQSSRRVWGTELRDETRPKFTFAFAARLHSQRRLSSQQINSSDSRASVSVSKCSQTHIINMEMLAAIHRRRYLAPWKYRSIYKCQVMWLSLLPIIYLLFFPPGLELSAALCTGPVRETRASLNSQPSFGWNFVDFTYFYCYCSDSGTFFMRAYDIICIHDVGLNAVIRRWVTFLWRAIRFVFRHTAHLHRPRAVCSWNFPMSSMWCSCRSDACRNCQMRCLRCGKRADKLNWRTCRMSSISDITSTRPTTHTHTYSCSNACEHISLVNWKQD